MTREVPFLNGLRAFAALWVVIAHCMIWGGWTLTFIPDPKIAVDLFMLISGFLMSMNAARREEIEPMSLPRTWLAFYTRRFFRLAPSYYLSLLVAVATSAWFLHGYKLLQLANVSFWGNGGGPYDPDRIRYTASNLAAHASFMFGVLPRFMNSTMLPDWSLSLEMQFYVTFPFIFLLSRKLGPVITAIALSILAFPVAVLAHGTFLEPSFLPLKLSLFVTGMMLAEIGTLQMSRRRATGMVILAIVLSALQFNFYGVRQGALLIITSGMFALLSLPAFSEMRSIRYISSILGGRLAHVLSDASYGIYLFHGFFISLCGLLLRSEPSGDMLTLKMWLVVVPCSVVSALIVSKSVERLGIKLGARISADLRARDAAPRKASLAD